MRGHARVRRRPNTRRMTRGLTRAAIHSGFALALLAALVMVTSPSPARAAVSRSSSEWIALASTITGVPAANEFLVEARVALAQQGLSTIGQLAEPGDCPPAIGEVSADPDHFTPLLASCCKICTVGIACGDTCISARYTCHVGAGCACNAGGLVAPPPPPPPALTITVVTQSPYPVLAVGQTVEFQLVAEIT